jgi:hypothetical protein
MLNMCMESRVDVTIVYQKRTTLSSLIWIRSMSRIPGGLSYLDVVNVGHIGILISIYSFR